VAVRRRSAPSPPPSAGCQGLGDIMLTCYGDLSRNRSVGVRLGRGERLEDILASSSQVGGGGSRVIQEPVKQPSTIAQEALFACKPNLQTAGSRLLAS